MTVVSIGVDVADEAVVHGLAAVGSFTGGALVRADQARIHAGDADGVDVHLAAEREQRVLMRPLSTIEVASMAFWSVTRRPCTMRVGTPSASVISVSCGPPPCTNTTRTPK